MAFFASQMSAGNVIFLSQRNSPAAGAIKIATSLALTMEFSA